mmetsp:Transcript_14042/g.36429  ORF Transcript_14042/g.36429 Transcript_14042/m.36429 type:complete len:143 (+) Transcript_14042:222-650(+)
MLSRWSSANDTPQHCRVCTSASRRAARVRLGDRAVIVEPARASSASALQELQSRAHNVRLKRTRCRGAWLQPAARAAGHLVAAGYCSDDFGEHISLCRAPAPDAAQEQEPASAPERIMGSPASSQLTPAGLRHSVHRCYMVM